MPEIQNPNMVPNRRPTRLADLNLIHPGLGCVYDIQPDNLLLIRDKIFNSKNKIKIKNPGYRLKAPALQQAFIVETGKYPVIVANPDTRDGRYNQDIGAGDDISITMKITLNVDKSVRSLRRLMEQQKTYKDAIRTTAEAIMRLLVSQYYQKDSHETTLSNYSELKKRPFDMNVLEEEALHTSDENIIQIANKRIELLDNYGINISKVDFIDIDYSDRIKQIITNNIVKENERKIAREEAELKKKIAADEAEAYKTKLTTEIQALRENGFTNEQIAYYMNLKNLPRNAVAVVGQPQGNMMSDYLTAQMAANSMVQDPELGENQNTNGRTR